MTHRARVRVFFDGREVPNHETAIRNLNRCDPRLLFVYTQIRERADCIPNRLYGTAVVPNGDAV